MQRRDDLLPVLGQAPRVRRDRHRAARLQRRERPLEGPRPVHLTQDDVVGDDGIDRARAEQLSDALHRPL